MSDKIRTLIVDDESLARDGVRLRLENIGEFEIIGEAGSGREAISLIKKLRPDLVFLDVQMPELDGFAVVEALPEREQPLIVFVTAFDQFAVAAFDSQAVDYVLKPIHPRRFARTLERVKLRLEERQLTQMSKEFLATLRGATAPNARKLHRGRFTIRERDRIFFVDAADIDWIGAENYYAALHVGKQTHLIRESLADLEEQLDREIFVRVHRSTIVNSKRIKELKRQFHGEYLIVLLDGTKLKLGRSYRQNLNTLLGDNG